MGTIASIISWTCTNCNLINPTECLRCLNCGNVRRILVVDDNSTISDDNYGNRGEKHRLLRNEPTEVLKHANVECASISRAPPGYLEINSNGYLFYLFFLFFLSFSFLRKMTEKKMFTLSLCFDF